MWKPASPCEHKEALFGHRDFYTESMEWSENAQYWPQTPPPICSHFVLQHKKNIPNFLFFFAYWFPHTQSRNFKWKSNKKIHWTAKHSTLPQPQCDNLCPAKFLVTFFPCPPLLSPTSHAVELNTRYWWLGQSHTLLHFTYYSSHQIFIHPNRWSTQ